MVTSRRLMKMICLLSIVMLFVIGMATRWMYASEKLPTHSGDVVLLVLIHATGKPEGRWRRDVIRKTWVSNTLLARLQREFDRRVMYKFVLGGYYLTREVKDSLSPEVAEFNDMIFLEHVTDEHRTLTQRTLDGFKHIVENDYDFSYVLKCDDDSFVDIKAILSNLYNMNWMQSLYWGEFVGGYAVLDEGIYAEHNWFMCDRYIPYAFGGGYLLSRDLIELIAQNAPYLQQYMNEDVSLASWLSPYNFVRVHDQRFDTGSDSKGCMKPFIVAHKIPPDKMKKYYKSLIREGYMCGRRTRTRGHWNRHMYDWSLPPSQCCERAS